MFVLRRSIATLALTVFGFGAGAAWTSHASAQSIVQQPIAPGAIGARARRGERGSALDIAHVERRLRRLIASLQQDKRDYAGHRVNAINLMTQADQQLATALQTDATTPR